MLGMIRDFKRFGDPRDGGLGLGESRSQSYEGVDTLSLRSAEGGQPAFKTCETGYEVRIVVAFEIHRLDHGNPRPS